MSSTNVYEHLRQGAAGDKKKKMTTLLKILCCVPHIVLSLYIHDLTDGWLISDPMR